MGYPQIIHLSQGFSVINHPAIGYPHGHGNPPYLENISGIFSWEWSSRDLTKTWGFLMGRSSIPGLVNVDQKLWKDPPFFFMGTSTISMGHLQ